MWQNEGEGEKMSIIQFDLKVKNKFILKTEFLFLSCERLDKQNITSFLSDLFFTRYLLDWSFISQESKKKKKKF